MEKKAERRGLGRGLSALMADVSTDVGVGSDTLAGRRAIQRVAVEKLRPNPEQPRRDFSQSALEDLAESIKQKGVLQPLIVRPTSDQAFFEIVAGERRWRAAQIAQIHDLPVIVRDFTDTEVLEVAIIENIQRADLNAIEENDKKVVHFKCDARQPRKVFEPVLIAISEAGGIIIPIGDKGEPLGQ